MFVCGERVCDEDAMEDVAKELARLDQPQFDPKLWKELKSIPSKSREFLEKTELSVLRPEEIQQWCVKTFWFLFYWPLETRLEFSGNQTFLTSRRVVPFRLTRSSLRVWAACSAQMWMHGDRRLATPESRSLKSQPRQNTRFLTLKKGSMPPPQHQIRFCSESWHICFQWNLISKALIQYAEVWLKLDGTLVSTVY